MAFRGRMACAHVQASALKVQARVYRRVFDRPAQGPAPSLIGGASRLGDLREGTIMNQEPDGLTRAIELMQEALNRLVDPEDGVVAMRLSHALDLARERQDAKHR